jgi:hypothetical protein
VARGQRPRSRADSTQCRVGAVDRPGLVRLTAWELLGQSVYGLSAVCGGVFEPSPGD